MIFLALIYLAFISLGLPDSLLGSSWPFMTLDFGVSVGNAGYVSMIVSSGTIISSLLAHRLIRRLGTGKVTVISVAMTAVALLGFAFAPSFWWLLIFAVPLGLGAGAVDSGLNDFVAEHYAARHMNWLHCFWGLGAMLGPALISLLTQSGYQWRSSYFSISIVQFVLVGLLLLSLPMWKKHGAKSARHAKSPDAQEKQGLFAPLRAQGSIFALLTFFLYTAIEASIMLWGASYLVEVKELLPQTAAGWVSLFFLGLTAGRMLSGFASIKLNNETLIRMGIILVIVGLVLLAIPLPNPITVFALVVVGLGLAPIFPSMLHQTPIYFDRHNSQAAMGLQMAFAYTGTTIMPPLFGQFFSRISFTLMPYVLLTCAIGVLAFTTRLAMIPREDLLPSCDT